jgi:hypothetical protein
MRQSSLAELTSPTGVAIGSMEQDAVDRLAME